MKNENKNTPLLTPEIMAQMPKGLVGADFTRWMINKGNELRSKAESGESIQNPDDVKSKEEYEAEQRLTTENQKKTTTHRITVSKTDNDLETVKYLPKSVMAAVRRKFSETASKADLISAVVYIFTDGDCEISEKAMKIVKSYKPDDKNAIIEERLTHIENMQRSQNEMLYSIELCTCYNAFDRRYGSQERRRSPKDAEFRESGNLDMLARLREQARDQKEVDDIERYRKEHALDEDDDKKF
ncbi:MAG: hypothetical protein ACI4YB_12600 [Oscillospiraceae bacterium]